MDTFRLDISQLPPRFYRVDYPYSTPFSETTGFKARDQSATGLASSNGLRSAVVSAFKWGSRIPSPFVAVFSDRDHAINWARSYEKREGEEAKIMEIATSQLTGITVLKLSEVVQQLGIELQAGASQHECGAYLCVKEVPMRAIVSIDSPSELYWEAKLAKERAEYGVFDFYKGGTESEDEAMQENINTIVEKNIEGGW